MMMQSVTSSHAKEGDNEPVAQAAQESSDSARAKPIGSSSEDRRSHPDVDLMGTQPPPAERPGGNTSATDLPGTDLISPLTSYDASNKIDPAMVHCIRESNELAVTRAHILPLHEDSSPDDLRMGLALVARLKEIAKELDSMCKAAMFASIEKHGELIFGDTRWYLGNETKTTCRDVKQTIETILEVTGGDLGEVIACLSSGCMKPGESRKVLGERFAECFEVTTGKALKDGEPLKKQLLAVNTRFLR